MRARNILSAFDDFEGQDILDERTFQDYQSTYIDLYNDYKPKEKEGKEIINDDIVFEIELIKQIEINIDYILMLVKKYQSNKDKEIMLSIDRAINSSIDLRSKKKLIHISTINPSTDVDQEWRKFLDSKRKTDLDEIIQEEKLKLDETYQFVSNSFRNGTMKVTGTGFDTILPPVSRFSGGNRDEKKNRVITKLLEYFELYIDLFYGNGTLIP